VSLVAVFLALALGIAMGSTVISKATVADLKTRIHNAEKGIDQTNRDNRALRTQLDALNAANATAIQKLVPTLVAGKLTDAPIVILATPSVDQRYRQQVLATLQAAGAQVQGTVVFDRRLAEIGTDPSNLKRLSDAMSDDAAAKTVTDPAQLWSLAAARLGGELFGATQAVATPASTTTTSSTLVAPPSATTTPTQAPTTATPTTVVAAPTFLSALRKQGLLSVEADTTGGDPDLVLSQHGYRLVVLGQPGAAPTPGKLGGFDTQFMVGLLEAITKAGPAPLVVGSVADATLAKAENPETVREWFLAPVRSDKALDGKLSTVNDLESADGHVALVLAVRDAALGSFGHYGVGSGANALAPSAP